MKTLRDQFTLTPEILQGMDGEQIIPQNVRFLANDSNISRAGDGIDACIHAAMVDASVFQDNQAGDVLGHLKYQRDQLSILIRNLEALPEMATA